MFDSILYKSNPRLTCPSRESNPGSEHSSKELLEQRVNRYSEHLHEPATVAIYLHYLLSRNVLQKSWAQTVDGAQIMNEFPIFWMLNNIFLIGIEPSVTLAAFSSCMLNNIFLIAIEPSVTLVAFTSSFFHILFFLVVRLTFFLLRWHCNFLSSNFCCTKSYRWIKLSSRELPPPPPTPSPPHLSLSF